MDRAFASDTSRDSGSSGGHAGQAAEPSNGTEGLRYNTIKRKLFGGAMECLLPAAFIDASDLRQVPDHQEVFVSRESEVSIVIELLSFEEDVALDDIGGASALHFFNDLGEAEAAASCVCDFRADLSDSIMPALASYSKAALAGRQTAATSQGGLSPETVRLYMVNVRLPHVGTDLLITVNAPYPNNGTAAKSMVSANCFATSGTPARNSDDAENIPSAPEAGEDDVLSTEGAVPSIGAVVRHSGDDLRSEESLSSALGVPEMKLLLHSFEILDWTLFC